MIDGARRGLRGADAYHVDDSYKEERIVKNMRKTVYNAYGCLGAIYLASIVFASGCRDTIVLEPMPPKGPAAEVVLDEETGEYVVSHPETGAKWLVCPVGSEWSDGDGTCDGAPELMGFTEVFSACPEGFRLPTREELAAVLCGLVGRENETCPNDQYEKCKDCDICRDLFGDDTGIYPTDGYMNESYYIGESVDFGTGCITGDGFDDSDTCSVRCVKESKEDADSGDAGAPGADSDSTAEK